MTAPRKTVVKEEKTTKKLPHTGTKGKLIKGMSGRLPRDILSHGAFTEGLRTLMKGYSGIYALYHGAQLYRVGLTTDLHCRLSTYTKGDHGDKWDSFVIFRIAKVSYLKDIETLVLQLTRPVGNKV